MKKQITAIISAALILTSLTACGNTSSTSGNEQDSGTQSSSENSSHESTNTLGYSKDENVSDTSSSDFDYEYVNEHRFDNVVKVRGVYGETEIPDIHYENANSEGCVTNSPYSDEWQYAGLESMEFETHTLGDYTIRLVGHYVRTDKEYFPDRIFGNLGVEIEKDGAVITSGGYSLDITGGAGAQFHPEQLLFPDKIGSYLDIYDLEYPVIAMNYYFGDNPERLVHKCVEFGVLLNDEFLQGFVGVCDPGCGVAFDFENCTSPETINAVNGKLSNCKAALFESEEFTVVDEKTLLDAEAAITYTFDFTIQKMTGYFPFELYTAKKSSAGSIVTVGVTCNGEKCIFIDAEGIYGETEIPDFHCDNVDLQGSTRPIGIEPVGLNTMVFETHEFGGYTIKVIGKYMRTDKEYFPDTIYARYLYIEVETESSSSDGSNKVSYPSTLLGNPFKPEYRVFPDRIGSYLDIYDMEYPIIAMNYYFDDAPEYVDSEITQMASFAMILPFNNRALGLSGSYEAGLGIVMNEDPPYDINVITNREYVSGWPYALRKSDELKAVDNKTLVDKTFGIKYSFDFPGFSLVGNYSGERLTVEKID